MTQIKLADHVGLTHQQIQKYEAGTNRVAAPNLWKISRAFGVRVDFFFEGYAEEPASLLKGNPEPSVEFLGGGPQVLRLIRKFRALNAPQKLAILSLIDSLSGDGLDDTSTADDP